MWTKLPLALLGLLYFAPACDKKEEKKDDKKADFKKDDDGYIDSVDPRPDDENDDSPPVPKPESPIE